MAVLGQSLTTLFEQGMAAFQQRFGQKDSDGPGYHFSNVRSGLIVALVSIFFLLGDVI